MEEFKDLPLVGDVRYLGLIGALELVKDKKTKQGFSFEERVGFKIFQQALKKNLVLRPLGDIVYFFLPLCIKRKELRDILDRAYSLIGSFSSLANLKRRR
jgi:adenosylmethionine-8-amino-7-oxononanoate aminotransferase